MQTKHCGHSVAGRVAKSCEKNANQKSWWNVPVHVKWNWLGNSCSA